VEKDINRASENRKEKDEENPGQFIGGFFLFIDYINTDEDAEPLQYIIYIVKRFLCADYQEEQKGQLNKYQ